MLVVGGRTRWARVVSRWSGLSVLLLGLGAGCGSRTSMLDPDVYSEDGPDPVSGASSGGSSNRAGSPAIGGSRPMQVGGMSGSAPTPTAGQPGMPTEPTAVTKTCQNYCAGYATKCPGELKGQDCQLACE